jgi:amino acid transporter
MIYIFVSGGSFGIEEMISSSGPGLTLLLLMFLPLVWALPMALIASELGSALPSTGGFYIWIRHGMGDFWAFQAAWWWSLAVLVDTSLYILLSVGYLQQQIGFDDRVFYAISWLIILLFSTINILGLKLIAIGSTLFSILIISPFLVLGVVGIANWQFNPLVPFTPPGATLWGGEGALILGLSIGMWLYSGYESMSTLAGEIEQPQRVIPRALMLVLPFVALMYLLPSVASLAAFGEWQSFSIDGGDGKYSFIDIGRILGGSALGNALLASAVLGNLALYLDYMASGSRPLQVLAASGLAPKALSQTSARFGTPVNAIVLVALVNAVLIIGPFQSLIIIDIFLTASAYAVIFITAVCLRVREPDLPRPFRIPLGTRGLVLLITPPLLLVAGLLCFTALDQSLVLWDSRGINLLGIDIGWYGIAGLLAMLSGPMLYPLLRKRYRSHPDTGTI